MRGIKFRAWDGIRMIIGEDVFLEISGARIVADNYETYESQCAVIGFEDCIKDVTKEMTLMQFTELRDKNGKEIYEGDVVLCNGSVVEEVYPPHCGLSGLYRQKKIRQPFTVEWHGHFAGWSFRGQGSIEIDVGKRDYEVIGNIYENPELVQP